MAVFDGHLWPNTKCVDFVYWQGPPDDWGVAPRQAAVQGCSDWHGAPPPGSNHHHRQVQSLSELWFWCERQADIS